MKRRDFRLNQQPLVMIIPMIDIMLFLLVFFMLGTIYMVQTNNFDVNLPQSETAQKEIRPNTVSITVKENGELLYENEKLVFIPLPVKIKQALLDDGETIFILYGDRETKYEKIVNVLEMLKKSGARHVSIATEIKD